MIYIPYVQLKSCSKRLLLPNRREQSSLAREHGVATSFLSTLVLSINGRLDGVRPQVLLFFRSRRLGAGVGRHVTRDEWSDGST
jgi:hypothetical protein